MKKKLFSIMALILALSLTMSVGGAAAADDPPEIQLAILLDGSASIDDDEWDAEIHGLVAAIGNESNEGCIPRDGSVELTVIQFGSNSDRLEWGPQVITNDSWDDARNAVLEIERMGGNTPLDLGINAAVDNITGENAIDGAWRIINISTDGGYDHAGSLPKAPAEAARDAAIDPAIGDIDEIDAEGIGDIPYDEDGWADVVWLRDRIVYPQPGSIAPDSWEPGWVYLGENPENGVQTAAEFKEAICHKVGGAPETCEYELTVTSDGCCEVSVDGEYTVAPGATEVFTFDCGEEVDLEALEVENCDFVEWTGDVDAYESTSATVTMNDDKTVTAVCETSGPCMHELTVISEGCCVVDVYVGEELVGSVKPGGEFTDDFACDTVVDLEAVEVENCDFVEWIGADNNESTSATVTMNDDKTVTAVCAGPCMHELTVTSDGCCEVSVDGEYTVAPGATEVFTFDCGEPVNVNLEALDWHCCEGECDLEMSWIVDGEPVAVSGILSVYMDDNHTVVLRCRVTPEPPRPSLARLHVESSDGGEVTNPGEEISWYFTGSVVHLLAVADEGYEFVNWTGDVADPNADDTTIYMHFNKNVTANFSPPVLVSIEVTPETTSITVGGTQPYTATVTYSDGSAADVTTEADWASSDEGIATIDAGLATGIAVGSTEITATLDEITSDPATLNVAAPPPVLVSIEVTPESASIMAGETQPYTATATYSDGSVVYITNQVSWASDESVATIDDTGLATGLAVGSTDITATFEGMSDQATLNVAAAPSVLVSIEVSPEEASIDVGDTQQFAAEATYDYGSVVDVTDQVSWTSDVSVATIYAGVATGVAEGSTGITATLDGITSGPATLAVTAPAAVAWWSVGLIIGLLLFLALLLLLLRRRRKRGEEAA